MVVHLLTFGTHTSKYRPSSQLEIGSGFIEIPVYQKVLLLWTGIRDNPFYIVIPHSFENPEGLGIQGIHGAEHRDFFIQRLPGICYKGGGDTESNSAAVFFQKCRRSGIPGGIPPGFKGGSQASRRKG